jgi:uncharacterized protein
MPLLKAEREEARVLMLALVNAVEEIATPVALSSPDHGPRHWRDVARVAHALWTEGVEAEPMGLFVFALMHDSQRLNEFEDPGHGHRAAALLHNTGVIAMLEGLVSCETLRSVELAMSIHNGGDTSAEPTVATCLDADRLTLYRVGIVPDPRFLSTEVAKEDAFRKLGRAVVESDDVTWEEVIDAYIGDAPLDTRVSVLNDQPRDGNASYVYMRRMHRGGELCQELQDSIVEGRGVLTEQWIMHPLIHEPFFPGTEAHLNERLAFKRKLIQEALDKGNWYGVILHHERPYRVAIFEELVSGRIDDDAEWWEVVSHIWTDSENIWQELARWRSLFTGAPAGDPMNDEEREVFDALPDKITVYRGTAAPDGMGSGMSWTLNKERADWFARRFYGLDHLAEPKVITAVVGKEVAIGYLAGRGEEEIVAFPEDVVVTDISTIPIENEVTA